MPFMVIPDDYRTLLGPARRRADFPCVNTAGASLSATMSSPPSFAGAELPPPESRGRKLFVRAVALTAIAVSVVYLTWRLLSTLDPASLWLSVPLLVLEAHALAGLVLFTFSLWDVDCVKPVPARSTTDARVAVLIPTYNEPVEVLLPTIAAAVALQPGHETWVLDDGNRQEVAALADRLGARYLARAEHDHAKAGNINHALGVVAADLVAVLDADHVAAPGFLTHTLGYFDDPKIAVVQTPQDFYNLDSFEHGANRSWADRSRRKARFNEQALFYRAIEPGKNRWGAAFWCGTGAVVRVTALRQVGGVATETVTEDIHTTIRLHRQGWKSVYHNEVLARGLAASDAQQYQAQRLRWGIGAMQVLRTDNPLTVRGLRLRQRLAYASTLLGWFDAWRSLGYLLVPPAVLFSGAVPIKAAPLTFGVAFVGTFLVQRLALALLGRGFAPQGISTVFEFVRMSPNIRATLTLLRPGGRAFTVTPKGRLGDDRRRTPTPGLLTFSLALSVAAAVWFALSATGHTPLVYRQPWAAYGAAFWLLVNAGFVLVAIGRVRSERFAGERRASVRFDVDMPGFLDGLPGQLHDISLTGARLSLAAGLVGAVDGASLLSRRLTIPLGEASLDLLAVVRSMRPAAEETMMAGLEFSPGQDDVRARLALALFNAQLVPELEPARTVAAAPAMPAEEDVPAEVAPIVPTMADEGVLVVPDAVPLSWLDEATPAEVVPDGVVPDGAPVPAGAVLAEAVPVPAPSNTQTGAPWRRSADDVLPCRRLPTLSHERKRARRRAGLPHLARVLRAATGRR